MGDSIREGLGQTTDAETVGSPAKPRRVYAYTLPGKDSKKWTRAVGGTKTTGTGLVKVGETTKKDARTRIQQQLGTAYPDLDGVTVYLNEQAKRKDGSFFRDHDVHRALSDAGIRRVKGEWFEATPDEVKAAVVAVRNGARFDSGRTNDFPMRPEQEDAVAITAGYFEAKAIEDPSRPPEFLWNAKMRFGKTFTTYQLAREMGWTRILVLTYKPAVQSSWRDDLLNHVDFEGWRFVDRETTIEEMEQFEGEEDPLVWFASFQDLGGKTKDGEIKEHLEMLYLIDWDCIVIDEYHFGAWREVARDIYDPSDAKIAANEEPDERVTTEDLGLETKHLLYLSGTPFRALTDGEFSEDQIFNWTYPQEQEAKRAWSDVDGPNPYIDLPGLEMYCYRLGGEASQWAGDGEFSGFSLSDYFKAARVDKSSKSFGTGSFVFEDPTRVSEFLNMLRGKLSDDMKMQIVAGKKAEFPYEAQAFGDAIRHSAWFMPDVASCYAMRDLLATHPGFKDARVVVAAGSRAGQGAAAKPPVDDAIAEAEAASTISITLTVGKLLTGVTVPQWGAILMLRSLEAPETYFQAAFRVQSPWSEVEPDGTRNVLKPTSYVFEFDPNRALSLVAEYGIRLATNSDQTPSQVIGHLLDYLPIYGLAGGRMERIEADGLLDWATAGIGATALAQRWNSPLLVNVNEHTLSAVLEHPELLKTLDQIEDFRALVKHAEVVVTKTGKLKKAKREQGGKLTKRQKKEQSEAAKKRKEIREKLQKFLANIPVFMYVTDFREEALKHVIESVDTALFERVTGLKVEDFKLLSDLGLFNAQHMNSAIYQFRSFERASLHYADTTEERKAASQRIGLWDQVEELKNVE